MPELRLDRLEAQAALDALAELRASRARLEAELKREGSDLPEYRRLVIQQRRAAVEREIDRLVESLKARFGIVAELAARGAVLDVEDGIGVRIGVDAGVVSYAQQTAAAEVVAVAEGVRMAIRRAVTRALAGGLDRAGLDAEIRRAFGNDVTEGRVERIARTETGRAYGQQGVAINGELLERGLDLIQRWTAIEDLRTRESHSDVDGQERELDEPFHVGEGATDETAPGDGVGFPCNAPQDPALPPEESIQCRCRRVLVPRSEARQPYIAKSRGGLLVARAEAKSAKATPPAGPEILP